MKDRDKNVMTINITWIDSADVCTTVYTVCVRFCLAAGISVLKLVLVSGHYRLCRCNDVCLVDVLFCKDQDDKCNVYSNESEPSVCPPSGR